MVSVILIILTLAATTFGIWLKADSIQTKVTLTVLAFLTVIFTAYNQFSEYKEKLTAQRAKITQDSLRHVIDSISLSLQNKICARVNYGLILTQKVGSTIDTVVQVMRQTQKPAAKPESKPVIINTVYNDDPTISIVPNGVTIDAKRANYEMTFIGLDATSVDVNFTCSFIVSDDFKNFTYNGRKQIFYDATICKGCARSALIEKARPGEKGYKESHYLIIWCRGTYKKADKSKTLPFDEVYSFNQRSNTLTDITSGKDELKILITKSEKLN
jgi:hypothetical protein